jgi:deferrochelatase/peroxidase EfeB
MTQALSTFAAPLPLNKVADAEQAIDAMGNPAVADIAAALDKRSGDQGTHFVSMHAIRSQDGIHAWLVLEFSADGSDDEALDRLLTAIGDRLHTIFTFASDWTDGGDIKQYLAKHKVVPGCGWFSAPGVVFAGTPNLSVGRILREARLAKHLNTFVGALPGGMSGLDRVRAARLDVANNPDLAPALQVADPDTPYVEPTLGDEIGLLLGSFITTYLWPAVVLIGAATFGGAVYWALLETRIRWQIIWFILGIPWWLFVSTVIFLVLFAIAAGLIYAALRRQEDQDWADDRRVDDKIDAAMFTRENHCAQNHMISVTQRKPGLVRWLTSRLIFWAIGEFAAYIFPPGFLSDIGTIHFARWVTIPGTRDLLFLSNYDSSWESYLEDFITRAHTGLTGVWSNTVGFPKAYNLVQGGATDGERFKRFARRSMVPTRFWYSAYPTLATDGIRANADIRRGLSGVMTEDDAQNWLALFGSAPRPEDKLTSNEIQSLLFGGMKFKAFGVCLLFQLPDNVGAARAWLRDVRPHIAFNDGHRVGANAIVTLALGAGGLKRLGLPEEGLSTFPFAFLEGMTPDYRARILGDELGAYKQWEWDDTRYDAVLLVYGETAHAVSTLVADLQRQATAAGIVNQHAIPLNEVTDNKTEPFGFVDGISQPVIRGTYKAFRNADSIHIVEPGEFILGYRDNRGNMPPGPTLPAIADPQNQLPLVEERDDFDLTQVENVRDLGMNGSFLVIRQLEQNVDGFDDYCEAQARHIAGRLSAPYHVTPEFIAAKLVGRWRDGSSLVRHPYESYEIEANKPAAPMHETYRPQTRMTAATPVAAAPVAAMAAAAASASLTKALTATPSATPVAAAPAAPPVRSYADNDFLYGVEDPEGVRCPFGAHIRRANPRDSLVPGSAEQVAISNRHRIIRVGRQYTPAPDRNHGLLFMCLNGDIERQFEFVQQVWLLRPTFQGLTCEKDPILGSGKTGENSYTIPSREAGPIVLQPMSAFVKTLGGGYFFIPGKRLIDYLSALGPHGSGGSRNR